MKMEQTECSETSAYKIQTPGNYPKESIQHTEHGESLKLRITEIPHLKKNINPGCGVLSLNTVSVRDNI